jgi:hypothetical protein
MKYTEPIPAQPAKPLSAKPLGGLYKVEESNMKNFDTRVYSIADFLEWNNNALLELSPDFQRRAVWSEKAKSYLIDSILRGKPIPKILISQKLEGSRTIRIVVDGQQRLRAILEYINGDFKLSRAHNLELADSTYESLPQSIKNEFLKYELGVDLLFDMKYEDVLDIFARINSYTVTLNKQENINAIYLGYFKQYVFKYGYKYVDYFIDGGILTKANVTRMAEAELAGDLFVALIAGVQTNKNNEQFYKKYEDKIGNLQKASEQFDKTMSFIGAIYSPEQISLTNWSRIQLFYTLFTSIAHCLFGLEGLDQKSRVPITQKHIGKLRVRLDEISSRYDEITSDMDNPNYPADYKKFITRSRRGTTDTGARIDRAHFVCSKIKTILN